MGYEISPTCFYLTKRSLIQKPNNYEVITELKSMITKNVPTHLPPANHHRNVIVDFMAYASKLAIKKRNLKTYNDFLSSLWSFFSFLFKSYNREDIVFDVYKQTSFKASEQRHRTSVEGTNQLLQVLINLLPWKLIESGLYQRIRKQCNGSSQSGYSTKLKVKNLINSYS